MGKLGENHDISTVNSDNDKEISKLKTKRNYYKLAIRQYFRDNPDDNNAEGREILKLYKSKIIVEQTLVRLGAIVI